MEELLISGLTPRQMASAWREKFPTLGKQRYTVLHARIHARILAEEKEHAATRRSEQIKRIQSTIAKLRASFKLCPEKNRSELRMLSSALKEQESLLADICGTREAVKIDVNVRVKEDVMAVIMNMSPEQMNKRLQQQHEMERALEIARSRGLLLTEFEDAAAE